MASKQYSFFNNATAALVSCSDEHVVLLLFTCFSIAAIFSAILYYILFVYCRHQRIRKKALRTWNRYSKKNPIHPRIIIVYHSVLDRRFSYISTYCIFQIIDKLFAIMSIVYSIIGMITIMIETPKSISFLVALFSLLCVIIALYLTPNKRIPQYISAWRRCDEKVNDMQSRVTKYSNIDDADIEKIVEDINLFLIKCENDLSSDCC